MTTCAFLFFFFPVHLVFFVSTVFVDAASDKPNIIFILADDLGWNDVSFHGYNEIPTPNIDQLANEGVILNSYYAHYMCSPSRSALMTGRYPTSLGLQHYVLINDEPRGLDPTIKILPQYLQDAGYKTHMIGKWHLGMYRTVMTPTFRGFESFLGYYSGQSDYYNYTPTVNLAKEYIAFDLWENTTAGKEHIGQYSTELFTDRAVQLIKDHDEKDPLFLYFSHMAPHFANFNDPVQAPQEYIDRFPHIALEGRRKYAGVVSALDDSVGRVIAALKNKGIFENSVIVFAADNGGSGPEQALTYPLPITYASNWPLRGAKGTQFEGGVRVAACVYSAMLEKKQRVSNELYHITDWLPTFMRLAGLYEKAPATVGYDIWDSISKDLPSPRTEILYQIDPVWKEYALRWNQYKLVVGSRANANGERIDEWYIPDGGILPEHVNPNAPGALKCEDIEKTSIVACNIAVDPCLYDVVKDPCEYRNIALDYPDILEFLLAKLEAYNRTALPSNILPLDPLAQAALHNGLYEPWNP